MTRQLSIWDIDNDPDYENYKQRKAIEDGAPLSDQAITDAEYAAMQDDARLRWLDYVRDDYAQNLDLAEMWRAAAGKTSGRTAAWCDAMSNELFAWCANERARAVAEAEVNE